MNPCRVCGKEVSHKSHVHCDDHLTQEERHHVVNQPIHILQQFSGSDTPPQTRHAPNPEHVLALKQHREKYGECRKCGKELMLTSKLHCPEHIVPGEHLQDFVGVIPSPTLTKK